MSTRLLALVLDDLRTLNFPSEYEVIHARTVEHAAVVLAAGPVDILVLDHDLGPGVTAKNLISFIQMRCAVGSRLEIGEIYIVSSNPQAHAEFPLALQQCDYEVKRGLGPAWIDVETTMLWSDVAREVAFANNPYE